MSSWFATARRWPRSGCPSRAPEPGYPPAERTGRPGCERRPRSASGRDLPARPVGPAEELIRLGRVRRPHGRTVPPQELARAESHVAEQDELREARGVAEVAGGS